MWNIIIESLPFGDILPLKMPLKIVHPKFMIINSTGQSHRDLITVCWFSKHINLT